MYYTNQGDVGGTIREQLLDGAGLVVPLDDVLEIRFFMAKAFGLPLLVDGVGGVDDPAEAIAFYDWQVGDRDIPGLFRTKWRVEFYSGLIVTFPSGDDYGEVQVGPSFSE